MRLQGPAIDVDADPLPDVVLEVDHTTDVRRRKLGVYKESGFPEVWVLVPWEASVRTPGLTIHVRHGEDYREEGESRAFPGWKAQEIHCALTEDPMSEAAWRALERTALAMGAREGTEPEHNPLMRSHGARAWTKGHAHGRMELVAAALRARGIDAALDVTEDRELLGGLSGDALMAAALACTDEADFRRRIREHRGPARAERPERAASRGHLLKSGAGTTTRMRPARVRRSSSSTRRRSTSPTATPTTTSCSTWCDRSPGAGTT